MAKELYAVINPDGELEDVVDDYFEAVEAAGNLAPLVYSEVDPDAPPADLGGADEDLGSIHDVAARKPANAVKNAGLRTYHTSDLMLSVEDAHAALRGYFPTKNAKGNVHVWKTPEGMVKNLLGQNYKTAKKTPEDPSKVLGLSLLPYDKAKRDHDKSLPMKSTVGLCSGSSDECRKSCLVFAGKNNIAYNIGVKLAKTQGLLYHPRQFLKILQAACARHHAGGQRNDWRALVRLNVFQDVPWELVLPSLFSDLDTLQFYDYTKVVGRHAPPNYDLTFSFSGVNFTWCRYEIDRGTKIAVVFLAPKGWKKPKVIPEGQPCPPGFVRGYLGKCYSELPKKFMGLDVIDGDISDVRPYDRDIAKKRGLSWPVVVGLRWKIPLGQKDSEGNQLDPTNMAFVVRTHLVEGHLVVAGGERHTGASPEEEVIE